MYPKFKKDMSLIFVTIGSLCLDASEQAAAKGEEAKATALKEADSACQERSEDLLIEYWKEELGREAKTLATETTDPSGGNDSREPSPSV